MKCLKCNAENLDTSNFCASCGSKMPTDKWQDDFYKVESSHPKYENYLVSESRKSYKPFYGCPNWSELPKRKHFTIPKERYEAKLRRDGKPYSCFICKNTPTKGSLVLKEPIYLSLQEIRELNPNKVPVFLEEYRDIQEAFFGKLHKSVTEIANYHQRNEEMIKHILEHDMYDELFSINPNKSDFKISGWYRHNCLLLYSNDKHRKIRYHTNKGDCITGSPLTKYRNRSEDHEKTPCIEGTFAYYEDEKSVIWDLPERDKKNPYNTYHKKDDALIPSTSPGLPAYKMYGSPIPDGRRASN